MSDIVETTPVPAGLRQDACALIGCIAGAASVETTRTLLSSAGFEDVRAEVIPASREFSREWMPGAGAENYVASASLTARTPEHH